MKILIADDHAILRESFHSFLKGQSQFTSIHSVSNGKEALEFLKENEIDIVLMDINMPLINGVECCKKISKLYPEVKVIALSMLHEYSFIKRMFKYGAKGYVLKDDSLKSLLQAIEVVSEGGKFISAQIQQDVFSFDERPSTQISNLTRREKEILRILSDGLSNKEMAEKLFLSTHTIDSHVKNLLSKFNARNKVELIKMAFEKGYL